MDLGKEFNLAPTSIPNWVRAADNRTEELEILGKALTIASSRSASSVGFWARPNA